MYTKTNHAGYEKDVSSNFVINKNDNEYALHVQNREKAKEFRQMKQDIETLKRQVASLQETINQMLKAQGING